jgi:hypothetical protein
MGSPLYYDAYGHINPGTAPVLPCIALSNSASATVGIGPLAASGTGGAGAGSTTSYVGGTGTGATAVDTLGTAPSDAGGQFVLTAAGTPVAGLVAQVNFTQPYRNVVDIQVGMIDVTASPAVPVLAAPVLVATGVGTVAGFQIASTVLTAAHSYQIVYSVQA